MDIFISWSGDRSESVAKALHQSLPLIIQAAKPWMSRDIDKGSRWDDVISAKLESCDFGIVCLTPESLESAWLLFEAGALSKKFRDARVCTYLFDLDESDVRGPLAKFQHTRANQADTWHLIATINAVVSSPLPKEFLRRAFDAFWPDLQSALAAIAPPVVATRERTMEDKIDEVLIEVRNLGRRESSVRVEDEAKRRYLENLLRSHPVASLQDVSQFARELASQPESYPFSVLVSPPRDISELRAMKCPEHKLGARLVGPAGEAYQVDGCCFAFLEAVRERSGK